MTQQRRQLLLLAILGAVLVLWVGSRWLGRSSGGGAGVGGGPGVELPRVARLDFEALQPEEGVFEPGRDIFRFGQVGPSPEELRRQAAAQAPKPAPPPAPPSPRQGPAAPQPPPVTLVFLGTFGPREAPIAVFSDREAIYNARQGDVIEELFIVRQIGYESVDLGFVGFPEDLTHRLAVGS
ncbi:MAG: hypothetical protein ACRD2Z_17515 [Thermoanaerobaculia bacterium]